MIIIISHVANEKTSWIGGKTLNAGYFGEGSG